MDINISTCSLNRLVLSSRRVLITYLHFKREKGWLTVMLESVTALKYAWQNEQWMELRLPIRIRNMIFSLKCQDTFTQLVIRQKSCLLACFDHVSHDPHRTITQGIQGINIQATIQMSQLPIYISMPGVSTSQETLSLRLPNLLQTKNIIGQHGLALLVGGHLTEQESRALAVSVGRRPFAVRAASAAAARRR